MLVSIPHVFSDTKHWKSGKVHSGVFAVIVESRVLVAVELQHRQFIAESLFWLLHPQGCAGGYANFFIWEFEWVQKCEVVTGGVSVGCCMCVCWMQQCVGTGLQSLFQCLVASGKEPEKA